MTGSTHHAIILFLYASDLPDSVIHHDVWKLNGLASYNENIEKKFDDYDWAKTNKTKMRELQEMIWKHRVDLFREFENEVKSED